jgi:hypothetical protein
MKITRRSGLFLSLFLVPALVFNPAPAQALVYPAGSVDTSWGNSGYTKFGTTFRPADRGLIEDSDGGALFPVTIYDGDDVTVGIHMMGANGQDDGPFVTMPNSVGFTYSYATNLGYDYLRKAWVLFSETNKGLQVSRFSDAGNLDTNFGNDGSAFVSTLIKNQIHSEDSSIPVSAIDIGFYDVKVSDNGNVFALGGLEITDPTFSTHNLVLWRIFPDGTLDSAFASNAGTGGGKLFQTTQSYVPTGNGRLILDPSGTELTVASTAVHETDLNRATEFYFKRLDVSGSSATDISILDDSYLLTNLGGPNSYFSLSDAAQTSDGKIFLVGDQETQNITGNPGLYSSAFRLNLDSGLFTSVLNDPNCYNGRVSIDQRDRAIISGVCSDQGVRPILKRVNSNGLVDETFNFTNSSLTVGDQSGYRALGMFEASNRIIVYGTWLGGCGGFSLQSKNSIGSRDTSISGCSVRDSQSGKSSSDKFQTKSPAGGYFFATAFRSSSYEVNDQPAPAPAPVPVVAPALPTQAAPVAVPAVMKVKKKLKFPITSQAGNPLKVTASGACKVSPVFKKVKVKVGKKTKKVKKQTGWTVQMKKKKKTCTITQSDAGGNGYAALSSTVTVTIK